MSTRFECEHRWTTGSGPGDVFDTRIHVCIKPPGHETDPTNDDHRCCCGTTTWVTEPTR